MFNIHNFYRRPTCIEEFLQLNKIEILNENEAVNLAHFGRSIGNDIFIIPYSQYCNEISVEITKENALSLLQKKINLFYKPENYEEEIKIIAENFNDSSEKLKELSNNEIYVDVLESIIKNDHLRLPNEDFLLDFIIEICNNNKRYEALFEYVLLEYCKEESIQRFLEYIEKIIPKDRNIKSIFSCLSRKALTQKFKPNWDEYFGKRSYNKLLYQTDINDPINGILKKEFQNNNVLMEASSKQSDDVYSLLKGDPNSRFFTKDEQNSWIKASLKDNKSFTIKKYSIRGNNESNIEDKLQSWKIEGKLAKTDNWIELDKHENECFDTLQLRSFTIHNSQIFDSVKITQIGVNSQNRHYLEINEFEISGIVYS